MHRPHRKIDNAFVCYVAAICGGKGIDYIEAFDCINGKS